MKWKSKTTTKIEEKVIYFIDSELMGVQKSEDTSENTFVFASFSNLLQQISFEIILLTSTWMKSRIFEKKRNWNK